MMRANKIRWWIGVVTVAGVMLGGLRAGELRPLVMQLDWVPNVQFAGVYMAAARGYYAEAGLAVEIRPVVKGVAPLAVVLGEEGLVMGCAESSGLLVAHAGGAAIKAVATMFQDSPVCWMVRADSGIESPADFAGRTVGIHGGGEKMVRQALRFLGRPELEAEITFEIVGYDPAIVAEGRVAAQQAYAIDEYVKLRLMLGDGARRLMARDYGYAAYSQVICTSARMVSEEPSVVRAFMAATQRGWAYALAEREATVDHIIKHHAPGLDREYRLASLEEIAGLVAPGGGAPLAPMRREQWERAQAMFLALGELARETDLDDLVDGRFNP
jgi:ABC-type nitrate/sulfonate/bicarbonate transport system substrate-binding protein